MIDFATCLLPELIVVDELAICVVQQGRPSPGSDLPRARDLLQRSPSEGKRAIRDLSAALRRWFPQGLRHRGLTELVDDEGITTRRSAGARGRGDHGRSARTIRAGTDSRLTLRYVATEVRSLFRSRREGQGIGRQLDRSHHGPPAGRRWGDQTILDPVPAKLPGRGQPDGRRRRRRGYPRRPGRR